MVDDPRNGHNRWHPDLEPAIRIQSGDTVVADTRDGTDGQITADSSREVCDNVDINRIHPLTGPIFVEGAELGDTLDVEILEIEPATFGFTRFEAGSGILGDLIDKTLVVKWTLRDGVARSPDLPGVCIPAAPFLGVVGVAPSRRRLAEYTAREAAVAAGGGLVLQPDARGAVPSTQPIAGEAVRTIPPRETGGNIDNKHLHVGSRLFLQVDVPGALPSFGDAHFAQGDGEACAQGLEMQARVHIRVNLRKSNEIHWRSVCPTIEYVESSRIGRHMTTMGIPVDAVGRNHDLDLNLATRNALLEMLTYLTDVRGYSREQAYTLASVAVDLHISQAVNNPNVSVSAILPLDIFD